MIFNVMLRLGAGDKEPLLLPLHRSPPPPPPCSRDRLLSVPGTTSASAPSRPYCRDQYVGPRHVLRALCDRGSSSIQLYVVVCSRYQQLSYEQTSHPAAYVRSSFLLLTHLQSRTGISGAIARYDAHRTDHNVGLHQRRIGHSTLCVDCLLWRSQLDLRGQPRETIAKVLSRLSAKRTHPLAAYIRPADRDDRALRWLASASDGPASRRAHWGSTAPRRSLVDC
ncbi:hypothetical protein GY45DRAFT_516332 [Cubamyces sp. BRFM 1775]|nr:hypothetical protein GY45DRAFT_516332 [Cubamyces sp. BRFM 1775]